MIRPSTDHPTQQRQLLELRAWERDWSGHESAQLRRMAALTLLEKVQWLEQAQRLAISIQKSHRKEGLPTMFSDGQIEY